MDEDKFALVEKIIKDVDNIMQKNAELCAFDIVPVDYNFQNKSPVLLYENCLGLESWCVKHVYLYCYSELTDKYFSKPKRKAKISGVNSDRLASLLNITLLLNPELSLMWNVRRELVLKGTFDKRSELQFIKLVLSRKPKCNDAFAYRRWLLDAIFQDETLQSNYIENQLHEELHICELASDKSANNYHSWNHRMWVVNKSKAVEKQYDVNLLYIKEYIFSEKWTSKHVSDFSCFHYRQFCIKNIFKIDTEHWKVFENSIDISLHKNLVRWVVVNVPKSEDHVSSESLLSYSEENLINFLLSCSLKNCNCMTNCVLLCKKLGVLFHELVLNNELLRFYKFHETLWYHRRFIVHKIIDVMYDYYGLVRRNGALVKNTCNKCNFDDLRQKQAKIVRYDSNRVYSSILFQILLCHEKSFTEERFSDSDNYADRHVKYLKFVEGLNHVMNQ